MRYRTSPTLLLSNRNQLFINDRHDSLSSILSGGANLQRANLDFLCLEHVAIYGFSDQKETLLEMQGHVADHLRGFATVVVDQSRFGALCKVRASDNGSGD